MAKNPNQSGDENKETEASKAGETDAAKNKVSQEILTDSNPNPARVRKGVDTLKGSKAMVKITNTKIGFTQSLPGDTAQRIINKNPNQFKLEE